MGAHILVAFEINSNSERKVDTAIVGAFPATFSMLNNVLYKFHLIGLD
jgi:hypothetical protein